MNGLHHWLATPPGQVLAERETRLLSRRLAGLYAQRVLQIGDYGRGHCPAVFGTARLWVLDQQPSEGVDLCASPQVLPLSSGSVDVVILVHQLEFTSRAHQVIREAARVLAPEGHLLVLAFNPYSLWGLRRYLSLGASQPPWSGQYLSAFRIQDWMQLLGLTPRRHESLLPVPPVGRLNRLKPNTGSLRYNASLGAGGRWLGGVNLIMGQKRVNGALTPPKLRRQRFQLIPGGLAQAGSSARHSREGTSHDGG